MKIAIALRTCGNVFNWWDVPDRMVDVSKQTLLLTCLNSLARAISNSKHEIIFSVHDDNSSPDFISCMDKVIKQYNIDYQLINTEKKQNCITQYQWLKQQQCDYVYHVEDDYLHTDDSIDQMVDFCEQMKIEHPFDKNFYAVFPVNHPHRYQPEGLYPSMIVKTNNRYWRTINHSSLTFFMDKVAHNRYDDYVRSQAYGWSERIPEDDTINLLWYSGNVRLLCPMESVAWHIADRTHEDTIGNWKQVWNDNLVEYNE